MIISHQLSGTTDNIASTGTNTNAFWNRDIIVYPTACSLRDNSSPFKPTICDAPIGALFLKQIPGKRGTLIFLPLIQLQARLLTKSKASLWVKYGEITSSRSRELRSVFKEKQTTTTRFKDSTTKPIPYSF